MYLENSLAVSDFYLDSRLTLGHQILNSKGEELADDLTNYSEAYQQGELSFNLSHYSSHEDLSGDPLSIFDISAISNDKLSDALYQSLVSLGGEIDRKQVGFFVKDNRNELTSSDMYGLFLDELMPQAGLSFENFIS